MSLGVRVLVGVVVAAVVALAARWARSLSGSGATAATVVGTVAVAAGWSWTILLLGFFVSSSLLSRLGRSTKLRRTEGMVSKPGPRDGWQVMSNGLPFLLASGGAAFGFVPVRTAELIAAGSLAASAADTWATEIGTWMGGIPRSILTWRQLAVGESGGVTVAGTVATVAGGLFVGLIAIGAGWPASALMPVALGGVAGSVTDSIIGAFAQRRNWCDACGVPTEMNQHTCGAATRRIQGLAFLENDAVNLLATVVGGAIAAVLG